MSAPGEVLRRARREAGLSQRALAARAGVAQTTVARTESGRISPTWETLTRMLHAAGVSAEITTGPGPHPAHVTCREAGHRVADALSRGDEPEAWRHVMQLLDDVRGDPTPAALLADRPPPTGVRRWDALLAATAAHLAHEGDVYPAAWTHDPRYVLDEWWFPSGIESLHAMALVQSPAQFRVRGIFLLDGALDRA
jgi:transcriptional regulator with XRE-family HTH domain